MPVIYFTRFPITYDKGGGARRMMQILELLKKTFPGLEVISSVRSDWIPKNERKQFKKRLNKKRILTSFFTGSSLKKWVPEHRRFTYKNLEHAKRWSQLILEQNLDCKLAIMDDPIYFAPLLETLIKKQIPVVAACQNIESLSPSQVKKKWVKKLFAEEIGILSQCRLVITISREEDVLLKNLGIPTHFFPYYPVEPILKRLLEIRGKRKDSLKHDILMIGNSNNLPTRQGMNSVIDYWLKNDLEKFAGKLIVGGFNCDKNINYPSSNGAMEFHSDLTNEDLDQFLCTVKAGLCYQRNGSGALTRICEMLIAGVPVLANAHAARSYYHLPGLIEFPTLADLDGALQQVEQLSPQIPLPLPPETSLLISGLQDLI
ncbi:MAG: hypothetical protein MUF15_05740 [Acidobacteria bacterium]|jgi:hypothetical protein|nr:hypothetical protein [Acidobacteriota bacterium]